MKYMILLAGSLIVVAWNLKEKGNIGLDKTRASAALVYKKSGCPTSFGDNYFGTGYYAYPEYAFNLSGVSPGTVAMSCDAMDVPNKVTVYDRNHNILASTGWWGTASYGGPWGLGLAVNGPVSANFTKGTDSIYYVKVETAPPSGTSDGFFITVIGCP